MHLLLPWRQSDYVLYNMSKTHKIWLPVMVLNCLKVAWYLYTIPRYHVDHPIDLKLAAGTWIFLISGVLFQIVIQPFNMTSNLPWKQQEIVYEEDPEIVRIKCHCGGCNIRIIRELDLTLRCLKKQCFVWEFNTI